MKRLNTLSLSVIAAVIAPWLAGCGSGTDAKTDDGPVRPDVLADTGAWDDGPVDPGVLDDLPVQDPGPTADAADDPGTNEDPGLDEGAGEDGGAEVKEDASGSDPGGDPGIAVQDATEPDDGGQEPWPPTSPWWGQKQCLLPACDPEATVAADLSGRWTRRLTAVSHDCNKAVESIRSEIKPGAVTTAENQEFILDGDCSLDAVGGTVTGVIRGDTLITCVVQPPELGVTSMPTGWLVFDGGRATGKSSVYLYGIPVIQPSNCVVEYDVEMIRQP